MAIYKEAELDYIFHALGDGTRREMLSMLAKDGPRTAGQLGEPFAIAQPTASKHLRVLEQAGLVERMIDGRTHRFQLQPEQLSAAEQWIQTHRAFWEGALENLDQYLNSIEEDAEKKG